MLRTTLSLLLLASVVSHPALHAQPTSPGREVMRFGTALRPNTLFAYRYTERVRQVIEVDGRVSDTSTRVLTYFFTERHRPHPKRGGLLLLEANVDSMRVEVVRAGDTLRFNTQHPADWENTRHREVIGPSVLVNRMISWTIDNYAGIVAPTPEMFSDVREQTKANVVDPFTRARVLEVVVPDYFRTIVMPWRGVVPVGRSVTLGSSYTVEPLVALDRTPFSATGKGRVERGADGKIHARVEGSLKKTTAKSFTYSGFDDPVSIGSAEGKVTGDLTLTEDGIVDNGWIMTRGMMRGRRGPAAITNHVTHEVFYETIGTSFYDVIPTGE